MLTRYSAESQRLDLHTHFRGAQILFGRNLGEVRSGDTHLLGKPLRRAPPAGLNEGFEFHALSLVYAKPACQAFASSDITKQTEGMETVEIRRARLKAWFKDRTLPEGEKSYLSQLINGRASFGEKAARRLEKTYKMPDRYLDTALDVELPRERTDHRELLEAWDYLLPGQQQEILERIKPLAAINRESAARFQPKSVRVADMRKRQVHFDGPDHRHRKDDSDAG